MHTFAFWLLPQEPLRSELRELIGQLATTYHSVAFEPHATIFFGPSDDVERATNIANAAASQFGPITMLPKKLSWAPDYTKTLFLEFDLPPVLQELHNFISTSLGRRPVQLSPHLSLLYAYIQKWQQRCLCRNIPLVPGAYRFDLLRVIRTEPVIDGPGVVGRWETIYERPLGAANGKQVSPAPDVVHTYPIHALRLPRAALG